MTGNVRLLLPLLPMLFLFGASLSAQPLPEVKYDEGGRSHPFDLLHTTLDVRLDFDRERVEGDVMHTLRSLNPALGTIDLDAAPEINISRILVDGAAAAFRHEEDVLRIDLPKSYAYDDRFTVEIAYEVSPEKGLYFVKKEADEPDGRDQIWTQGEGEDHHYWIPMYDYPNDLATSEIRATLRSDWKLLANGEFVSADANADGTTTWHYRMEKPHAPYLMMLAAGDYLLTRDTVNGIPLEYWSYPDMPDRVEPTFGRTPEIVAFLEEWIGIPYPWNKYSQVMIDEFMYGGMENTTATTLNDFALVDRRGLLDYNPDGLIAHEAAHQWFGDLVTNRSWEHLWIHESFATYLAALWTRHHQGEAAFEEELRGFIDGAIRTDREQGRSPIAGGRGYTSNIYGRGAAVLHSLHTLIGEELFRKSIRLFLERHAHGVVETNDLKLAFEDATGYNLGWFFDQWIYGAGMPILKMEEKYKNGVYSLTLNQVQKTDDTTGYFSLHVPVEIFLSGADGIQVMRDTIFLDSPGVIVEYDMPQPVAAAIASSAVMRIEPVQRSNEGLLALLEFSGSPQLRRQTAEWIGEEVQLKRREMAAEMKRIFAAEPVPYVRAAVLTAVAELDKEIAREMVLPGLASGEKEVRLAAVRNTWVIGTKEERRALLQPLLTDSSYAVVVAALEMLVPTGAAGLEETLARLQYVEGQRESIARAWLEVVASGKFVQFTDRVVWYARNASRGWTRTVAFAALAKLEQVTPEVRAAIVNGVRAEGGGVFKAALTAAEELDDDELNRELKGLVTELEGERKELLEDIL